MILIASGTIRFANTQTVDNGQCTLTSGLVTEPPYSAIAGEGVAGSYFLLPYGGTRTFTVAGGSSTTFRLVCSKSLGGEMAVFSPALTALFIPS